jgi:ATP-dependent RNA helicase SUPV3L1/SUV3
MSSFYEYAEPFMPQEVSSEYSSLRKLSDMRFPSEWFPEARQMQRKIILHVGPTNSGKTYRAIQRLQSAESGIYCGPLRLLAHEIYDKMNEKGVACNLLTGEERRVVSPTAPLTSSTVEMANLGKPLEVAVIDEIQLIADPIRGWAWTQALLGLKAKEIHLCGEASAVPLVKKICESLGEQVVVNEYERLTPVALATESLRGSLQNVEKGDCVISFSRKEIFATKQTIEKKTGLRCAVAYGNLPPGKC